MLAFEKVVNALEERHFHAFYHDFGCTFYHPKMLLAALLFAYSQGIFSGRKIEKMMIENIDMQYLAGQLVVSYRTINRFRVAEGMEELIRDLFVDLNLRLDEKEVNHLIKYAMFDKGQKKRYKQSARNLANWCYDDKEDSYTHPDGWCYRFHPIKH